MHSGRRGGAGNPGQDYFYDRVRLAPFAVLILVKLDFIRPLRERCRGVAITGFPRAAGGVESAGGWGLQGGKGLAGGGTEGAQLCWRAARRRRFALGRLRPEVRLAPGPLA